RATKLRLLRRSGRIALLSRNRRWRTRLTLTSRPPRLRRPHRLLFRRRPPNRRPKPPLSRPGPIDTFVHSRVTERGRKLGALRIARRNSAQWATAITNKGLSQGAGVKPAESFI